MGVGNYRASFERSEDGVGDTFIVDVPHAGVDGYEAYREETIAEGHEPMGEDELLRENASEVWDDLVDVLREKSASLPGMEADLRDARCSFDGEFTCVATDGNVEIGYRSWENDMVVAVAPAGHLEQYAEDPDAWAHEIVDAKGIAPSEFRDALASLCDDVSELLRIRLIGDGSKVRRRTSAWTSAAVETPADPAARIAELEASIAASSHALADGWDVAAISASDERRLSLAKAIDAISSSGERCSSSLECLYAGEEGGSIKGCDPVTGELTMQAAVPASLRSDASAAVADGTFVLPDGPALKATMAERLARSAERTEKGGGRHSMVLGISPAEYLAATGKAVVVVYDMGDGETERLVLAGEDPEPAASPRM